MNRRVAIVQARTGSRRLPGKVLADIEGRPVLAHVLERLQRSYILNDIMVATTTKPEDDGVAAWAHRCGVSVFRGHEHDVLSRFASAAVEARADVVVRITADCPLIDPWVVDLVVGALARHPTTDYVANTIHRTFPKGLDVEAMHADVLARIARLGTSDKAREHVTWLVHERPGLFVTRSVIDEVSNNADLSWTVDNPSDLEAVRRIYAASGSAVRAVPYQEMLVLVRSKSDLITRDPNWSQPS